MALTDPTLPATAPGLARPLQPAPQAVPHAAPYAALAHLSVLRGEAARDLGLLGFLARAPRACLILMAAGTGLLLAQHLNASNASLEREFVWVLSLLTGILAITGLHIRSYAQNGAPITLEKAARLLLQLLFYTGAAWGSGALLVMPASPLLIMGFAVLPCLAMTLLFGERASAFTAPVILASAASLSSSALWGPAAILAAGLLIFCLPMLQREISARREPAAGTR